MLAKGLRTYSVYDWWIHIVLYLDCIQAQKYSCTVKDDFRLLIKGTVFIELLIVKEIMLLGLYNTWKTFSLLYRPSTVISLCCDAPYDSCRASSCAPHADQHR